MSATRIVCVQALFPDSAVLYGLPRAAVAALGAELRKRLGGTARGQLVYRGSRDGMTPAAFHRSCDGLHSTVTLIMAEGGWVFGGYTSVPWESGEGHSTFCEDAFVFTVTNPHGITPTLYPVSKPERAMRCGSKWGPSFGYDIRVTGDSPWERFSALSFTNFPFAYADTTGLRWETFTGASNFTPTEVETWHVTV